MKYVLVYPEEHDVVLAGPAEGWRVDSLGNVVGAASGQPVLLLDDLMAALRALGTGLFGQRAAIGALPTLYAATDAGVNGCDYIGPKAFFGMRGAPGKVRSNARSYDETLALRLWDVSEALTSVHFDLLPSPSAGLVTH